MNRVTHTTVRGFSLVALCGCALVLTGAGASAVMDQAGDVALAAVSRQYNDPQEGTANAPDVTTVIANDLPDGYFTVDIFTPNYHDIHVGDEITVYLNTDRNRANNNFGAEYALYIEGTTPACRLYRWTGSDYAVVRELNCPYANGPTFTFLRSDVGSPLDFEFWILSTWTSPAMVEYRDTAPDSGWWIFDPTPPDTAISGGPTGSTTATTASFTVNSSEAGATFQCSLDGAAYAACGNPASYQNLARGNHTFHVRSIDPSGNIDPSPAGRFWIVRDGTPPSAQARAGQCCDGRGRARLEYRIGDDSGQAQAILSIYPARGSKARKAAKVCASSLGQAQPTRYFFDCQVPLSARGWLRFCVIARDMAGNDSPAGCKRVAFRRLTADAHGRFVVVGKTLRVRSFSVSGRAGGKVSFSCRRCQLRGGRPQGATLRPGAAIEVRVVKPRVRGTYIRLANVGGAMKRRTACLPPGMPGPVVPCTRTS